nr:unnamed protein product [Callosobruchus analis]
MGSRDGYIEFQSKIPEEICTERSILSAVAQCYDHLGLLAPFILYLKLLVKRLWQLQLDWDAFHDSFSALIHNNNRLSNVEKLHYLRSCLRGEAAKVVCSLKTTDANYSVAWQLIKERFENKRAIVNQHLKCLFELPNIHRSSAEALRQFSYNVVKEIRCLESLGEPINTWDSIMLYLLSSKIDNGTRLAWEMFLENNSNTTPTLEEFLTFLKSRCHTLENVFSNPFCSGTNQNQNMNTPRKGEINNNNRKGSNIPYRDTRSYNHISTDRPGCGFCNGPHFIYNCNKLLDIPVKNRIKEIKRLNLCMNCLRRNHITQNCIAAGCRLCNQRHNTMLHLDDRKINSSCFLSCSNAEIQNKIEKFWILEEIPKQTKNLLTSEEQFCEYTFTNSYKRDINGRFIVSLPLKESYNQLCDNFDNAKLRLLNIEKKMLKNPDFATHYIDFMRHSILDINEKQKMASQCIFDNNSVKTLGMLWDPHSDKLLYSVDINYKANKITKRSILSITSQIFDPLGLICPLIKENIPETEWRYVEGNSNPADCLSRGLTPRQLVTHPIYDFVL